MRLSNTSIARLQVPADKSELIEFDDALPGFGVRVRAGGGRTWICQYRVGRKQRRVSLGKTGTVDADKARKAAKTLLAQVQLGRDPKGERDDERARAVVTLKAAALRYLEHKRALMKPRSFEEIERHLTVHWKPLADTPVHKIDRARVATRLGEIMKDEDPDPAAGTKARTRGGPVAANRARSTLSAFFTWAMGEGIAETNPVVGTNKNGEETRERVLSNAELVAVWNACHDDDYGRIVRLLILTGQRREEVAAMRESELNRDLRMWLLPSSRTKNRLPHDVPLSDAAMAVLPERLARGTRDLLFGQGEGGFSGWSRCKDRLDERCGVVNWTLHDLRRTCATGMGDIGIQPHVIEATLNHISGARRGVAGIYNRAQYAAEKRQAADLWADHVLAILAGKASNIVPTAGA